MFLWPLWSQITEDSTDPGNEVAEDYDKLTS